MNSGRKAHVYILDYFTGPTEGRAQGSRMVGSSCQLAASGPPLSSQPHCLWSRLLSDSTPCLPSLEFVVKIEGEWEVE